MKIRATAAIANQDINGFFLTEDGLRVLEKTSVGVPVTVDFSPDDRIGTVVAATLENGVLYIDADVVLDNIPFDDKFLVPGFAYEDETVLTSISYGITENPRDKRLSPIEEQK